MEKNFVINTRCLSSPLTGVQRYTQEIHKRLISSFYEVKPESWRNGVRGHLWEQLILPHKTKGKLLWSPANTGPLQVTNQVLTIHDITPLEHPEWMNAKFASWYQWLIPRLAKNVKHIFADSEYTKHRIQEVIGIPSEKIDVVYPGVDVKKHLEIDVSLSIKKALNIPFSSYILSLCSLEPRKNLGRLLKAWKNVVNLLPEDIGLVLAGGQGKSQVFKGLGFDELPERVFTTGYVDDYLLPGLYSEALCFVYVSMYEGFGLPPLEAMAYNTPVIAGNLTSVPEVVGDAGILINPYDIDALAENILKLINNEVLRQKLISKGTERVKLFTWDNASKNILNTLNKVQSTN